MIRKIILGALIAAALYFLVQGGEYSTFDVFDQQHRKAALTAEVEALQREVDSLERVAKSVRTDPLTQERIAREEFGMVRDEKEILYRFVSPDSN